MTTRAHPPEPIRRPSGHRRVAGLATALVLCGSLVGGCRTAAEERARAEAARAADEARVRRAAEDWVRALFPEVEGDITRAAVERALLGTTAGTPSAPSGGAEAGDVPAQAITAVRRGDYVRARSLLGELVTSTDLARARELLARGDERGALAALDRAVATAPDSVELRLLRGESALSVGTRDGTRALVEAASEDFEEAVRKGGGPRAHLGASRAAAALGRTEPALAHARAAIEALDGADAPAPDGRTPERLWAEAVSTALARADARDAEALAAESRTALEAALARAPEDPWTWRGLAALEMQRGDDASARATSGTALRLFPRDAALHATFAGALERTGGPSAVSEAYARLGADAGEIARVEAVAGRALLDGATANLERSAGDPAAFEAADARLAHAAELAAHEAEVAVAAASVEDRDRVGNGANVEEARALVLEIARDRAACRTGAGFARLSRGDLEGARSAFLSVEEASRGALTSVSVGRATGFEGLARVAAAFAERGASSDVVGDLERAARVEGFLREYAPDDATVATRAARRQRDAAIATELAARRVEGAERAAALTRARDLMEASHASFTAALALAPEDARLALEAGIVLAQYLQRDPDAAIARLDTAIRQFETRRADLRARAEDPAADATARAANRRALEEVDSALADAFQARGVVDYALRGDPLAARGWFERCVATSPDPREDVRGKGGWIERCETAVRDRIDTRVDAATRWAPAPPR